MFSWSFSKPAEAMFSRWAIKRICKFLLKKKLGKFILGDIDLNQLDVQLGAGTIQLSDLALNVDYINDKLGTSPVVLKEGSIGSLMVVMPWKEGGCRIEVDELEVVLGPRRVKVSQDEFENSSDHTRNGENRFSHGVRNPDGDIPNVAASNPSVNVHEGVKTIARLVKWLLTSFYVKVNKLIVAFDPLMEEENGKGLDKILVLRISEAECGANISEDASSSNSTSPHNFLGLNRLTNYLKFHGAVLELINADGLNLQSVPESCSEMNSGDCVSGTTSVVLSGERGGFSGNLRASLPWKNGSLDIRKVDADLHIEPLELRLQPSTIKCFISLWNLFRGIGDGTVDAHCQEPTESLLNESECILPRGKELFRNEGIITNSLFVDKYAVNNPLSESHLISNWVSQTEKPEKEPDLVASVDHFFECFDELRNSQSALGSSGMWNWTCSVFSAITAASNLAAGSLHVSSEQQHVETSFNITIGKVSVLLFLNDEDEKETPAKEDDNANNDVLIHCVCAQFMGLFFNFQVYPLEMSFEGTVQHIQFVDHFCSKNEFMECRVHRHSDNYKSEVAFIERMQNGVQGSLQTFLKKIPGHIHQVHDAGDISLSIPHINGCCHMSNGQDIFTNYASVTLLKTSGVTRFHVKADSHPSTGSCMGPISFSLELPPFVFWVNFDIISMILELLKAIADCIEFSNVASDFHLVPESENDGPSLGDHGKISRPQTANLPTQKNLRGNIFVSNARIITCFPLKAHKDLSSYSSCNQFIIFDFVSQGIAGKGVRAAKLTPNSSSKNRFPVATSCSLNIKFYGFYLFSVNSAFPQKIDGSETRNRQEASFSVNKIASIVSKTDDLAVVSMFRQEGHATGPWIARKAKLLASSGNRSEDHVLGKGCAFASVTTVKDSKDLDSHTRQDILSSSAFLLHGQLPALTINADKSQFDNICDLLNQVSEHFSGVSESVTTEKEHTASQASILMEFDSMAVSITLDPVDDVKCSMRSELPGSWHSLTLAVDKFELLSVSNIGGIRNANFLWVAHGQGRLWGSITEGLSQEFLLISCSALAVGRGNGEGSNVLSSKQAGSDIINMWDPESNHNYSSIIVKCATIVAVGGRLDWFSEMISFFTLASSESKDAGEKSMGKTSGSSFVLNLVDVGLSYEPHLKKLAANQDLNLKHPDLSSHEKDEVNFACLLAASSAKLSNTALDDNSKREYKIRLQDLGLLVCKVTESKVDGFDYSVKYLRKIGYVKVAEEANVEALLRMKSDDDLAWELECQESHIMLTTCHDTTFGLIRLASQLQSLLAPDMHDYIVHLENRWNNVQQVHENKDEGMLGSEISDSLSKKVSSSDKKSYSGNLMDEIHEDMFQLDGNSDGHAKLYKSKSAILASNSSLVASSASSLEEKAPSFIEEYFLSDLRPLSDLALKSHSSDVLGYWNGGVGDTRTDNSGWYAGSSLRIFENHTSKVEQTNALKPTESKASINSTEHNDAVRAEGRIMLKNMNVIWRMHGGSDWSNSQSTCAASGMNRGRDTAFCLELALSGIDISYEVYPEGNISASKLSLVIQDFYVNDRSNGAPWRLVLGYYKSKKHPRNLLSKALKLNLEAVRPDPALRIEENRLRVSLLPIRLHLHQSQLDFLISFFGGERSSADPSSSSSLDSSKSGELLEKCESLRGCSISEEAFLTYFQESFESLLKTI
ncbi:autophagy-related protein 2 isoform X2 [Andrographis paniculata]|uniref:autophagy-related protein 2 isoform X2 n=1 Tax=Andrographis paniculata TaxID=175694 RepID=UPI0021E8557D|nr:autophagy-related protein 2 isoform X2 [Andrographis paniculata]